MNSPLSELQVIAVRYRSTKLVEQDERALDAYAASGVYAQAGVPFQVVEPRFPEHKRIDSEPQNLGLINGLIADEVAQARRAAHAVLMTGGSCAHTTGVVGGLQDAHGPAARIGLVWFDAHGDFNTPQTTLSGSLGGMPVAVCAGLAFPGWRQGAHIAAPLPTDRIIMVDVRNLDQAEAQLIHAVGIPIAAPAPDFPGQDLQQVIQSLADRVDMIYLHIDADILDQRFVPDHGTPEPNGPDIAQVQAAIETVMATGKVAAFALVSIYAGGPGRDTSVASGIALLEHGLRSWKKYGMFGINK